MAISEVIRDVLSDDETLAALLPGGIYSYEQTGRNGISRLTTPDAYAAGFLQPCAVVRLGELRTAAPLRDTVPGARLGLEVYLYDDSSYSAITAARDLVVGLLDRQWVAGAGYVQRTGSADEQRDPKLNNAALVRLDFEVTT